MYHRHPVLDGDRLPSASLDVDVAARQAGQDQGLFAINQMATIQPGADLDSQSHPAHAGSTTSLSADEDLGASINHRLDRSDDGEAGPGGLFEVMGTGYVAPQFTDASGGRVPPFRGHASR
jgi:hypothetical protein